VQRWDKIVAYLNVSNKRMLEDPYVQTQLGMAVQQTMRLIDWLREIEVERRGCWSFCCEGKLPYGGLRDVERHCERLRTIVQHSKTNFSLVFQIQGVADVQGEAGANIRMDAQYKARMVEEPGTTHIVQNGDETIARLPGQVTEGYRAQPTDGRW